MKYEEWRKLAVITTDLRAFGIDGFQVDLEPVPGIAFMQPVPGTFRGHPIIERWDPLGWITRDDKRGTWDVQIENTEQEFIDLELACRYLWDHWWKEELDPGPPFLLIGVDSEGKLVTNRLCSDWRDVVRVLERELPDPEWSMKAREALSKVGARYFEFPHGHYAAFPLEK